MTNSPTAEDQALHKQSVAPEAVEVQEDSLAFPGAVLFPITVRCSGVPGSPDRAWTRLSANDFYTTGSPIVYSLALLRQAPDVLRSSMRARRTLFEGILMVAANKTGRRPSMAEQAQDHAMDAAESQISMGKPIYRAALLAGLYANRKKEERGQTARRTLEATLRAKGFTPERLYYVAERALAHFQPGGELFSGLENPLLMIDEITSLVPPPARQVFPSKDAVWIGHHANNGRDVYFSFTEGLDPEAIPPPHALTLIMGEQGSGKTSLLRLILLQKLLQGRTVVSIDPEGENNKLCAAVGGRVIPAGEPEDKEYCLIHPLQATEPSEMLLAVRFLIAALGGDLAVTPGIQAVLHEAVKRQWGRKPGTMSLSDLVEALGTVPSAETSTPMALLRPYIHGSLMDGFFDRPKAILSPDFPPGQWWNFDLSGLREENRAIVHAVLAWFIYHAITVGRRPMDVFIDEGWRLLRSGPFSDLLDELGRRARKRNIGISLVTHLPADLARNTTSMNLASTAFIGRLGPDEAYTFFRSLGVPDGDARRNAALVSNLPPRTFLAAPAGGRGALFPINVEIPQHWLEFWQTQGAAQ